MPVLRERLAFEPPRPWSWPSPLLATVAVALALVLAFIAVARRERRAEQELTRAAEQVSLRQRGAVDQAAAER